MSTGHGSGPAGAALLERRSFFMTARLPLNPSAFRPSIAVSRHRGGCAKRETTQANKQTDKRKRAPAGVKNTESCLSQRWLRIVAREETGPDIADVGVLRVCASGGSRFPPQIRESYGGRPLCGKDGRRDARAGRLRTETRNQSCKNIGSRFRHPPFTSLGVMIRPVRLNLTPGQIFQQQQPRRGPSHGETNLVPALGVRSPKSLKEVGRQLAFAQHWAGQRHREHRFHLRSWGSRGGLAHASAQLERRFCACTMPEHVVRVDLKIIYDRVGLFFPGGRGERRAYNPVHWEGGGIEQEVRWQKKQVSYTYGLFCFPFP